MSQSHNPRYAGLLRVVIESPCAARNEVEYGDNFDYLNRCLRDSIGNGEAPIASHGLLAFSGALQDNNPEHRSLGTAAGWAWIPHADKLIVYNDYGVTEGMRHAINIATLHGIAISYRQLGKNEDPAA